MRKTKKIGLSSDFWYKQQFLTSFWATFQQLFEKLRQLFGKPRATCGSVEWMESVNLCARHCGPWSRDPSVFWEGSSFQAGHSAAQLRLSCVFASWKCCWAITLPWKVGLKMCSHICFVGFRDWHGDKTYLFQTLSFTFLIWFIQLISVVIKCGLATGGIKQGIKRYELNQCP